MPPISWKKVLVIVVVVILLAKLERIKTVLMRIGETIDTSLDPLWQCPPEARYVVSLLFYALIFLTVYKLLMHRKGKS